MLSYIHPDTSPLIFNIFLESKDEIIRFCDKQILEGNLSTEALRAEIKNIILPQCYAKLINETDVHERRLLLTLVELLAGAKLTTISYATVSKWMKVLGYRYDENKRSYFTDGHERDDVVKYRNDVFLNEYFESEKVL